MRHLVEVRTTGPDDPDGTRSGAVLSAYFELEQAEAMCRQLWFGLPAAAGAWGLLALYATGLSATAVGTGFVALMAVAGLALVHRWRAMKSLDRIVGSLPASLATRSKVVSESGPE